MFKGEWKMNTIIGIVLVIIGVVMVIANWIRYKDLNLLFHFGIVFENIGMNLLLGDGLYTWLAQYVPFLCDLITIILLFLFSLLVDVFLLFLWNIFQILIDFLKR